MKINLADTEGTIIHKPLIATDVSMAENSSGINTTLRATHAGTCASVLIHFPVCKLYEDTLIATYRTQNKLNTQVTLFRSLCCGFVAVLPWNQQPESRDPTRARQSHGTLEAVGECGHMVVRTPDLTDGTRVEWRVTGEVFIIHLINAIWKVIYLS